MINPTMLRRHPQLAAIELLIDALETAIVALCAAHPSIEHELENETGPPSDQLADRAVERAIDMLDALDRYRFYVHDRDNRDLRHRETLLENDPLF